ncbi:MAG: hypothetical protein K2W96_05345 [Gemmataceae bacterium]|nr:hypothetical protein [Gemmataceae bacterium]
MQPAVFDEVRAALESSGPSAAADQLCAALRESREYHLLFYALLMKKRLELGASPIPTGPAVELPAALHAPYEEGIRAAAREVGTLFLGTRELGQAWSYFRMIDEPGPVKEALEAYEPGEDDDIQPIVQLAFYEALAPRKGFDLLLSRYGTCSAITTMSSAELPFGDDVKQHCIKALVRRLTDDLKASLSNAIAEKEGTPPPDGTVAQLIAGRDWLFGEDSYHLDTSHLSAVVQMAMNLPPCEELEMARGLCAYGARLSGRFLGQDDLPFDKGFADYGVYLGILAGDGVDEGVAHFRRKLEEADPEEIGTYPAEVLVNLLLKLGRGQEALAAARKWLGNTEGRPLSCPSVNELCQKLGDYGALAETARKQGDPVHWLAGLIAARG